MAWADAPRASVYNMRGGEDRPHGMAFYGTRGSIFADRIGYDIYPEEIRCRRSPEQSESCGKI